MCLAKGASIWGILIEIVRLVRGILYECPL